MPRSPRMDSRPQALLIDEGELRLALSLLEELRVGFLHLRGSQVEHPLARPERLLITTSVLAAKLRLRRARIGHTDPPFWMAFVSREIHSERRMLRDSGFDFLIPEAVHPAALRLLMMRALYRGENTQSVLRVPFGDEITIGSSLRRQPAVLLDLSPRGCKLLTQKALRPRTSLSIHIPHDLPGGKPLQLEGIILRSGSAEREGGQADEYTVGMRFTPMSVKQRDRLKAILKERVTGPKPFSGKAYRRTRATPATARRFPRAVYQREVHAFRQGANRVLLGRDLSEQGMRIERNVQLRTGDRLTLAIHGADREEPLVVAARVARDDGSRGMALLFDVEPSTQERLRRLINTLPRLQRLGDDGPDHTALMSELSEKS